MTDCDFTKPSDREIDEYPFYGKRLYPIDWKTEAAKDTLFCDPYFPADKHAILDQGMMHNNRRWATYCWKRPSEVYGPRGYKLFDTIDPNDIKQGNCGDCYFLSSISSLAEEPSRIKRIFLQNDINRAGCYAVTLYLNGEKKVVVVDDRFPYDSHRE